MLRLSPCLHRSLEGLNQELEEVFVKEQGEEELLRVSGGCSECSDRQLQKGRRADGQRVVSLFGASQAVAL